MSTVLPLLRPSGLNTLPGTTAAFTTRHGGASTTLYASLNLGLSTDDAPEAVATNRRRLAAALGVPSDQLAIAGQVHGRAVLPITQGGLYPGYDGLVTATPGVLLCITAADCAAVLLADPTAQVIGACHAGWRGTVAGVVEETIAAMQTLGAHRPRLHAYISPCISKPHFEVGEEVAAQFAPTFVHRSPDWPRPHVDLKAALRTQLTDAGLTPDAITLDPGCTVAGLDDFFSYRAEQGTTGRMMGVIALTG